MMRIAPDVRPVALGILAAVLLVGRLALELHPYEHLLYASEANELCLECAAAGPPPLRADVRGLPLPSVAATPHHRVKPIGTLPGRAWTRPPGRGPPPPV